MRTRDTKLAGHVFKDKTSSDHLTVTWKPPLGKVSHGKQANTFIDTLLYLIHLLAWKNARKTNGLWTYGRGRFCKDLFG